MSDYFKNKFQFSRFQLLGILFLAMIALFFGTAWKNQFKPDLVRIGVSQSRCQVIPDGLGPIGSDSVKLEKVVSGLEVPWGIAFLPSGNWLVTERPGRIRLVKKGILSVKPVAKLPVSARGESGLLGIVVHPKFSSNRYFYVYYTHSKSSGKVNRVERFRLSEDETRATSDKVILDDIPANVVHDGGKLRFGPDGMLYIGTGDSREPKLSQDANSLAGKILRITDDGQIPPDNPLPGKPVYILGIRNTQGFDWQNDKTLFITDHGPSGELLGRTGHDKLTVAKAGANLGWPTVYGCESRGGFVAPSLVWEEAVPPGGAAFYWGDQISGWKGSFLIGSLGARGLQRIIPQADGGFANEVYFQGDPPNGFGRLREVVLSPDHQIYITTSNCDGRGTCGSEKDKILRLTSK